MYVLRVCLSYLKRRLRNAFLLLERVPESPLRQSLPGEELESAMQNLHAERPLVTWAWTADHPNKRTRYLIRAPLPLAGAEGVLGGQLLRWERRRGVSNHRLFRGSLQMTPGHDVRLPMTPKLAPKAIVSLGGFFSDVRLGFKIQTYFGTSVVQKERLRLNLLLPRSVWRSQMGGES